MTHRIFSSTWTYPRLTPVFASTLCAYLLLVGCSYSFEHPEGRIVCDADEGGIDNNADCPEDWFCRYSFKTADMPDTPSSTQTYCFKVRELVCEVSSAGNQLCATNDPEKPLCSGDKCVECMNSLDCPLPSEPVCDDLSCVACSSSSNCARLSNTPYCKDQALCVECLEDAHCSDNVERLLVCNKATDQCASCNALDNTGCGGTTPYCLEGLLCVECVEDSDCLSSNDCDLETRTCNS